MNLKDLAIATISWARNSEEESLLRESLGLLSSLGIPVFLSDGGSPPAFMDFIKKLSHFTPVPVKGKGLWAQAKSSVTEALHAGSKFILYTEPDKLAFFHDGLPKMLEEIRVDDQTGVVLASRSPQSFATFPAFQQMTETTINFCCAEIIGKEVDYTYGPFLMKSTVAALLETIEEDMGWGWRPLAFGLPARLGLKVEAYTGDFSCPPDQRKDDPGERLYRMKQLSQNMEGILLSQTLNVKRETADGKQEYPET